MEGGRCRDCHWWGWDYENDEQERDCRLFSDWPMLDRPRPPETLPEAMAFVAPFAGADGGTLMTSPDFGCVQFQPRDEGEQG